MDDVHDEFRRLSGLDQLQAREELGSLRFQLQLAMEMQATEAAVGISLAVGYLLALHPALIAPGYWSPPGVA